MKTPFSEGPVQPAPKVTPEIVQRLRHEGLDLPTAFKLAPVVHELATMEARRLLSVAAGVPAPEPPQPEDPVHLSPRELEVMRFLALRMSYKEIGAELNRSAETVKSHVSRAFRKLGITRAADIEKALRRVNPNSPSRVTTGEGGSGA